MTEQAGLRFVLVHGAMHDGSCWQQVMAHLNRLGHACYAPTMAGHGEQAGEYISKEDCVQSLVEYIEQHDIHDFVIVGHSFAGIILPDVSVRLADRIRCVVFQNAMIMQHGECIYDVLPPVHQRMFDAVIRKAGEHGRWLLPFNLFRECFINTADLATAKMVYAKLRAVCIKPQLEEIAMREFLRLTIPRSFINFTDDKALPPGAYGWYPRMAQRLGVYRLVQRPGDHEACYTCPEILAEALVEAARP